MFGAPGRIYVYRIYGVHLCLNVVTGPPGEGSAVLIRALEPRDGIEEMRRRRGRHALPELCNGPGKLCQALGVEPADDGKELGGEFTITRAAGVPPERIAVTERIGVGRGAERRRRYVMRGNPYVSRRVPASP